MNGQNALLNFSHDPQLGNAEEGCKRLMGVQKEVISLVCRGKRNLDNEAVDNRTILGEIIVIFLSWIWGSLFDLKINIHYLADTYLFPYPWI